MGIDQIVDSIKVAQDIIEDNKEHLKSGEYVDLCNLLQAVYNCARTIKKATASVDDDTDDASDENDDNDEEEVQIVHTPGGPYYVSTDGSMRPVLYPKVPDEEDEGEDEEEEEPERERTEDDMGVNELAELWGWNFDFGRPNATLELEGLIWTIVEDMEAKRVCAAVRVLNGALKGSKSDDPADAERILEWKEELIEEDAIRVCGQILERLDCRGFHNENHDEHWLYSIICDEILELLLCLGNGDALFRTKMRRNGVLKAVKAYAKERPNNREAQELLRELS